MAGTLTKVCCLCGKDVANAPRVKDPHGHYYCHACHQKAAQQKQSSAKRPVAAAVAALPRLEEIPPDTGEDSTPAPAPPTVAPKPLEVCPNCGARVIASRRTCLRCQMDLTNADKVLAMQKRVEEGSRQGKAGIMVGKIIKVIMIIVVIGVLGFSAWGVKMMFTPPKPYEDFPMTRAAAIKEFLQHVSKGTDKGYEKAFILISIRVRQGTTADEFPFYQRAFVKMHDDFAKKYGNDWPSRAAIKGGGGEDAEEGFVVTIDGDDYHISTQVQIPVEEVLSNIATPNSQPTYPDNAKHHFGILEVEEYPAHPRRGMGLPPADKGE